MNGNREDTSESAGGALERCRRAVKDFPESAPHHYNLGLELAASGRTAEAVETFRRASELDGADADALCEIGRLEIAAGRLNPAAGVLERALERVPDHARSLNNAGVVRFLKGLHSEAADLFRAAVGSDPGLADAWFNLADTAGELGRTAEEAAARQRYRELAGKPGDSGDRTGRSDQIPRAEEIIAETYRQLSTAREGGESPVKVIMRRELWEIVRSYRISLGTLTGPLPDYLTEDGLFGLEIWYGDEPGIRVE